MRSAELHCLQLTQSSRLPQKQFMKKDTGRGCTFLLTLSFLLVLCSLFPWASNLWKGFRKCHFKWDRLYHPDFISIWCLQLWIVESVCSSLHLLTHARCAQCSPLIPLWLASQVLAAAGGTSGTESPDRALHIPVSHDGEETFCLSVLLVHQALWSWRRGRFL